MSPAIAGAPLDATLLDPQGQQLIAVEARGDARRRFLTKRQRLFAVLVNNQQRLDALIRREIATMPRGQRSALAMLAKIAHFDFLNYPSLLILLLIRATPDEAIDDLWCGMREAARWIDAGSREYPADAPAGGADDEVAP